MPFSAIVAAESWSAPNAFSSTSTIFSMLGTTFWLSMNSATGWKKLLR